MHVYLLPLRDNRYDLYCEMKEPANLVDADASRSVFARWRRDFVEMGRAAEPDQPAAEIVDPSVPLTGFSRWIRTLRSHLVRWIAASIAEQRLLWNLRRQKEVMLVYPKDLEASKLDIFPHYHFIIEPKKILNRFLTCTECLRGAKEDGCGWCLTF